METNYADPILLKRRALRLMLEGRVPEYLALLSTMPRTTTRRLPMEVPNPLKEIHATR
ncbi:MAG TPA: hypothetical protein VGE21_12510 [Flavobacteriales bacterium]